MIVNILLLDYSDRMKLPCCPTRAGKIVGQRKATSWPSTTRSEEHTSELQSQSNLVCRLLLEKKKNEHSSLYKFSSIPPFFTTSHSSRRAPACAFSPQTLPHLGYAFPPVVRTHESSPHTLSQS